MRLDALYAHLHRIATRSRKHQAAPLAGGARLAVGVEGDWTAVTFSRREKELSITELLTFQRICGVPPGAQRTPIEGQRIIERDGVVWHSVSYRWQAAAAEVEVDAAAMRRIG